MAESIANGEADAIIYSPWDAPQFVKRALDRLSPVACVVVEPDGEMMPVMLDELVARGIPAFLVDADIPAGRESIWKRRDIFYAGVYDCFDVIMTKSRTEYEKFIRMGISKDKLAVGGNCKIDALFARRDTSDLDRWRFLKPKSPLFLAGSVCAEKETEIVLRAFTRVRAQIPNARLIFVPRYPHWAEIVVKIANGRENLIYFSDIMNAGQLPAKNDNWNILIVDRVGFLFELYAIADAAFVGGSLAPNGGQNLMEPAVLGIPTIHGPYMDDFPEAAVMDAAGVSAVVRDEEELAQAWAGALEPGARGKTAIACKLYFETAGGAVEKCWNIIKTRLPK